MSTNIVTTVLSDVGKFISTAAPNLEAALANTAKEAITALENAVEPVAEAAADDVITYTLGKLPGATVETAMSIAFVNAVIAKLTALLPAAPAVNAALA